MSAAFQDLLGQIAGLVSLLGFVPYLIEIVRGVTRPSRTTWWIWTVVGAMLCSSYYASGARHTIWVALSYVIGPLVVAILSMKYGEGGWSRFDRGCLLASALSLVVWFLAGSPLLALIANIGIDLCGALPTLRTAYEDPEAESMRAWAIFLLADVLNLVALGSWSLASALYPSYLFALAGTIVVLLSRSALTRDVQRLRERFT